ncbi:hypothetical protein PS645_04014 [Pseudomonas fluorescens]|uniref:Uncharacterized protein n=1 Tax=Pseudomonas fluorescens TaxID=294 RepID=A0A5E6VCP7_PSEFL|nr:hypothetical protein PS645_04014 [Pseudomonas fluorescens]
MLWEQSLLAMAVSDFAGFLRVYSIGCRSWPAGDGDVLGDQVLRVYISVSAVMAAIGFALTASHLEEPQVTKGSCP